MTYVEKIEKITEEDREFVRSELASLAEWIKQYYATLNYADIRRFLREMLSDSLTARARDSGDVLSSVRQCCIIPLEYFSFKTIFNC